MTSLDADVVVVGGGPAGSAAAAHLARAGHAVLVIDKASFPREKACAEYLSPGVVRILAELGVLHEVLAAGAARLRGMEVSTARSSCLISYDGAGAMRHALGVPRSSLDHILLDNARRAGASIAERVRIQGAVLDGARVVGVRARVDGRDQVISARFVVAADGIHSTISRSLGLDLPVRWPRRLGLVARYEGAHRLTDCGEMHVGRGVYCGLAPVGNGLVNVGLVGALGIKPSGMPTAEFFERQLHAVPGVTRALGAARRVTPVRGIGPLARRVRRVEGPGYLLVGDAAGFLDPFTGEGIHRALRGAEIAARAVSRALERDDPWPVGYARERRAAFRDKERVCLLVQAFLESGPVFDYVVRRMAGRPPVARILSGVLGDCEPAGPALHPAFLWSLLRP